MSFLEVLKGVGPKIAAGVKNLPATIAGWSQTTQIIVAGCTAGSLMVASVGGVAVYQHNTAAKEAVEVVTETETETQTQTVIVQEETEKPSVQTTELVNIPNFVSCKISSDSLEKDLTLYIKGENNSKISGEAFQIKLISPNDKKKLSDAIDAIEDINERIENASEEAASGNYNTSGDAEGEAVAADEGNGLLILGEEGAVFDDVTYVSSDTGLALSEKETLLIEKEKVLQDYCDALAGINGESYTDDNSDGMIYISKINSGDYLACLIPTNDYIPSSLTVKVNVKDKLEYKAVETIEDKTVSEAVAGDVKETHEEIVVENVLKDTVEWVESYVVEGNAKYETASPKFAEAAAVSKEAVVRLKKNAVCTCDVKCTEKNDKCPVCKEDHTKCQGCNCTDKCTSEQKNSECPKCKENISNCKGTEKTCTCDTECTADNTNGECLVCKADRTKCQGCKCKEKCTSDHMNSDCPKCSEGISNCKGAEKTCSCTLQCTEGNANGECSVCKIDHTKCQGKTCKCTYTCKSVDDAKNCDCEFCKSDWENCPCTTEKPTTPATEQCTCRTQCTEGNVNSECTKCQSNISNCKGTEKTCSCDTECTEGNTNEECPVCSEDASKCSKKTSTQEAHIINHYSPKLATSTTTTTTTTATEYTTGKLTLSVSATTIYNTADGTYGSATVKVASPDSKLKAKLVVNDKEVEGETVTIKASEYKSGTVTVYAYVEESKETADAIETPKKVTTEKVTIAVVSAETALKDASNNALFTDNEGKTAATVGHYKNGATFYYKSGSGEKTYYGWQTIDGTRYYFDKNGNKVTGEQVILGNKYNFGSDGALLTSGFGIDVSKWQGNIDWSQAKSAVSFAIIRAGIRGTTGALSIDSYAGTNIKNAKANGVKVGLYFYSRAQNEVQAVEEASLAVSIANQYGGISLPIYIDMEDSTQLGLSNAQRDAIVLAFCQTVKNAGYSAGVYANKTWLTKYLTPSTYTGYSIWCAQYNTTCTYTGRYDIWQYSSKGSIPGIKGNVDLNQSFF